MATMRCKWLSRECSTHLIVHDQSNGEYTICLFGIGRNGINRFYAQVHRANIDHGQLGAHATPAKIFKVGNSDRQEALTMDMLGGTCPMHEIETKSIVLSREAWITATTQRFQKCGIFVMQQNASALLTDLQSALAFFGDSSDPVFLENEPYDPRVINIRVGTQKTALRVSAYEFASVSRGCTLAVNDLHNELATTNNLTRCADSPLRFCVKIDMCAIADLVGYMETTALRLDTDIELNITLCTMHGILRLLPTKVRYRSLFEAIIECGPAEK